MLVMWRHLRGAFRPVAAVLTFRSSEPVLVLMRAREVTGRSADALRVGYDYRRAYAVRVTDAFGEQPVTGAHDGTNLVTA
jgi:hypothetical protein